MAVAVLLGRVCDAGRVELETEVSVMRVIISFALFVADRVVDGRLRAKTGRHDAKALGHGV